MTFWITIYHIDKSDKVTKYGTGSIHNVSDPAEALGTFWKYEHYMPGDGWDWIMSKEEFNQKFADGIRVLYMDFIPNCGFDGTSIVEIQLDTLVDGDNQWKA